MHTIRAQGASARTQGDPFAYAFAVAIYLAGHPIDESAEAAGVPYSTLASTLGRMGLRRSRSEALAEHVIQNGTVPLPARRGILQRDYTRFEAYEARRELAEQWGVTVETVRRDRKAVGMELTEAETNAISRWGSVKAWHQAQRRAALLRRQRGLLMREIADEIGCTRDTVRSLIDRWDARKGSNDDSLPSSGSA